MSVARRFPWHILPLATMQHRNVTIALEEGWTLDCAERRDFTSRAHAFLAVLTDAVGRRLRVLPNGGMLVTYDGGKL